jgi:hypothetical protein
MAPVAGAGCKDAAPWSATTNLYLLPVSLVQRELLASQRFAQGSEARAHLL